MSDRVYSARSDTYRIGGWTLCVRTNRLTRGTESVELESRLVYLLSALIDHRGEVLSKRWLLTTIWRGKTVTDESLSVAISRLRKALGDDTRTPLYIKTVPGIGYQLIADAGPAMVRRRRVPWALTVVAGVAVCLAAAGVWWRLYPAPAGNPAFATAERQIAAGDPQSLKTAARDMRALAEREPGARAFTLLAEAKMRLMGDAIALRDNCAEVTGLLDRAIALDGGHARAYLLRGDAVFHCRHDARAAEADYRTTLRLQPDNDEAALRYASLLLAEQRFSESLAQIEAARRINPLHYSAPVAVWLYQMQGRDSLAAQELTRMESAGADDRWFHISAMRVHARAGREAEAFAHLTWLMRESGFSADRLNEAQAAFAAGGLKAVNTWLLTQKDTADLGQYTPPLSWARYALAAGDTGQALTYLEQAAARHQSPLLWAAVDPAYAPVRDHPRFRRVLAKFRQPQTRP